jgi:hypothetical protein
LRLNFVPGTLRSTAAMDGNESGDPSKMNLQDSNGQWYAVCNNFLANESTDEVVPNAPQENELPDPQFLSNDQR